jgi:hypothetical protein
MKKLSSLFIINLFLMIIVFFIIVHVLSHLMDDLLFPYSALIIPIILLIYYSYKSYNSIKNYDKSDVKSLVTNNFTAVQRFGSIPIDDLHNHVINAFDKTGWKYKRIQSDTYFIKEIYNGKIQYEKSNEIVYKAKVKANMKSYGEKLTVIIYYNGSIFVNSKCVYPLTFLDWGRNRDNVSLFFSELNKLISYNK